MGNKVRNTQEESTSKRPRTHLPTVAIIILLWLFLSGACYSGIIPVRYAPFVFGLLYHSLLLGIIGALGWAVVRRQADSFRNETLSILNVTKVLWLWILGSGLGALTGAHLAIFLFPDAAFARNPTGQFGLNLVGFALSVSTPFAIAQWLVLRYALRYRSKEKLKLLALWAPLSAVAIAIMIFPLWSVDARLLIEELSRGAPLTLIFYTLPGLILLGAAQWFILSRTIAARWIWIPATVVGGILGTVAGLFLALAFFFVAPELTWALVSAAGIGAVQGTVLLRQIDADIESLK